MEPQFLCLAGLLLATMMLGEAEVSAEPITFYFEGHVTLIHDYLD